jgi:hypothetical protein
MSDPRYRGRRTSGATNAMIIAAVAAIVFVVGLFAMYSYQGSERMDNTAASSGTSTSPSGNVPGQGPSTTGSNAPARDAGQNQAPAQAPAQR